MKAHHTREMRILTEIIRSGVLRWSHTRETHDTWTSCCVTTFCGTGRVGRRQYFVGQARVLAKKPPAGADLPVDQARSFKSRYHVH